MIADFEYAADAPRHLKEFATFELSLASAKGQWIVKPTTIDPGSTTGELALKIHSTHQQCRELTGEINNEAFYNVVGALKKFYGTDMTQATFG